MSSSSDLETNITPQIIIEKKKKSTKKKSKPPTVTTAPDPAKNEGDDPHWAYEPPEGALLLDHTVDAGPFDWDALKDDDDTEIWLVRVPDTIKPKHLHGLELDIDLPSSSRTARIGSLSKKHASYDVWSIGNAAASDDDEDDDNADLAGAEELCGLTCLLPRKRKKGRLYVAPKRVTRHVVVSARPSKATPPEQQPVVHQNPPRLAYPKDVLKHAFVPYGARSEQTRSEDVSMDVDDIETTRDKPADTVTPPKGKPRKAKESKGKKRKGEGESPKKSKKHKTDA